MKNHLVLIVSFVVVAIVLLMVKEAIHEFNTYHISLSRIMN